MSLLPGELWEGSQDQDTQVHCVLMTPEGETLVQAANRLPDGIQAESWRLQRPEKYKWIQHAERRAIDKAARAGISLEGATAHVDWFPCSGCAASLVQVGIKKLCARQSAYEDRMSDPRYGFDVAMSILRESGVEVVWTA